VRIVMENDFEIDRRAIVDRELEEFQAKIPQNLKDCISIPGEGGEPLYRIGRIQGAFLMLRALYTYLFISLNWAAWIRADTTLIDLYGLLGVFTTLRYIMFFFLSAATFAAVFSDLLALRELTCHSRCRRQIAIQYLNGYSSIISLSPVYTFLYGYRRGEGFAENTSEIVTFHPMLYSMLVTFPALILSVIMVGALPMESLTLSAVMLIVDAVDLGLTCCVYPLACVVKDDFIPPELEDIHIGAGGQPLEKAEQERYRRIALRELEKQKEAALINDEDDDRPANDTPLPVRDAA